MNPSTSIKRRSFLILLLLTLLWVGLVTRLWWIQLGSPHHFSPHDVDLVRSAIQQREQSIILHTGRGDILDRRGISFTGVEQQTLILFPFAKGSVSEERLQQVAKIVHIPVAAMTSSLELAKAPIVLRDEQGKSLVLSAAQVEAVNALKIPGILALPVTERYQEGEGAKHVIGFVNQNPAWIQSAYPEELQTGKMTLDSMVGASGLEQSFDPFLQGVEPSKLSYYVDGKGNPLRGLDVKFNQQENAFYPLSLVTTMDHDIQERMERVADESGMSAGSIVVLDAKTAAVVAMVSRPQYNQSKVNVAAGDWQNHAIKELPPGSVFKTVVAAAALGEGVVSPTEKFHCEGEYGKYGFSCWKKEGHGWLTLEEAFAQSCNVTFAQIAKRIGGEKIEEYAKRLGLSQQVGHVTPQLFKLTNFQQIAGEDAGRVFAQDVSRNDEGILIQTAIGQRDVRMTPLQAANLMVTIANGGNPQMVKLVDQITYKNGANFYHFSQEELGSAGIDSVTAYKLRKFMRDVVTEGTGSALQETPWTVAGKSGTAQISSTSGLSHHWFAGFTPVETPRYAIAVVVENQPANRSHQATAVFAKVVAALADQQAQSGESPADHQPR